MMNDNKEP